jgi:hypothetical protein
LIGKEDYGMKKLLTIAVVAVFVLTMATVTYAVEVKMGGYVRNRTALFVNADDDALRDDIFTPAAVSLPDEFDDTHSWIDYRFRLKFDFIASEDLKGTIYFEGDDDWGGDDEGDFGADGQDVEIKNAYVSFNVPFLSDYAARATVGIHGFFLGGEFGVDDDASGATLDFKVGEADIRLAMFKELEDDRHSADDATHYGARVRLPMGDFVPWAWFDYAKYGRDSWTGLGNDLDIGGASESDALYWIGGGLDGKIGPVSFKSEITYSGGTIDYQTPVAAPIGPGTIDEEEYGGFVIWIKGEMPVNEFSVGAEVMYTSELDALDLLTKGEYDTYLNHPGRGSYRPFVAYSGTSINDSVGLNGGNSGGEWLVKGWASFKPLDWLSVTGYVGYIADNVNDGDRYGTSVDALGNPEDEDSIGIEVGATAKASIYKGLTYSFGVGWLFAGDALDQFDPVTGVNESPDDPWAIVSQLIYKF